MGNYGAGLCTGLLACFTAQVIAEAVTPQPVIVVSDRQYVTHTHAVDQPHVHAAHAPSFVRMVR